MRAQINLSDEMVNKLDMYAKVLGMSRSALCAYFIGQGVMGLDKANDTIASIGQSIFSEEAQHLK